ncbi:hypothetical protein BCR42DRAFT_330935 [Absidia repens]|uniref:SGNH hydrolase-type esterase domain-containing protein n=1 Tax=Absidia repens TaxID=90262 RepID=A0A1X2IBI2_9FUNG|nr:hypothetical protein BCR42DRAFT_330935 [Absidia repens]
MKSGFLVLCGLVLTSGVFGASVTSISNCPALTARTSPPKDITDLRPDDIKVLGALGDSIMAGYVMMGVSSSLDPNALVEFRGQSYAIGADSDAITLANFMNHYQPAKKGPSVGSHLATTCNNSCSQSQYRPDKDVLNGALSGAMAFNLEVELGYVLSRMKSISGVDVENDWKMITLQIGSNDQCASCNTTNSDKVTAEQYGASVEAAVKSIQSQSPKTIVNIIGAFNVSQVFPLSQQSGLKYCRMSNNDPSTIKNLKECACSADKNHKAMDDLAAAYNQQLISIADKYKAQPNGTFAVIYRPANINIMSFPIDALSNYDCFHPSQKGHQWMAKVK